MLGTEEALEEHINISLEKQFASKVERNILYSKINIHVSWKRIVKLMSVLKQGWRLQSKVTVGLGFSHRLGLHRTSLPARGVAGKAGEDWSIWVKVTASCPVISQLLPTSLVRRDPGVAISEVAAHALQPPRQTSSQARDQVAKG